MYERELTIEEVLNLAEGTLITYEHEKVTEIRHIKHKPIYGVCAECRLGYYMPISKETQERHRYKIWEYLEG